MNEEMRLQLFHKFFNSKDIAWERVGEAMEFRIDNGMFILDNKLELYDKFLRQYGLPRMVRVWGTRFLCDGVVALVCRVHLWHFATQVNSISELSHWERSLFILSTKDVRLISNKLLQIPTKEQSTPDIESLLKKVALYRLSNHRLFLT